MPVFNSIQSFLKPSSSTTVNPLTTAGPAVESVLSSPPSLRPQPPSSPALLPMTGGHRPSTNPASPRAMVPSSFGTLPASIESPLGGSPTPSRLFFGHRPVNEFDADLDMNNRVLSIQLHDLVTPECNAMGVNPSGGLAMIAGRQNYILIDLDQPDRVKATYNRPIRQAIPELQFNYAVETLAAVAVEKKVEIVDWGPTGDLRCLTKFAFHAKPITDLSWHEHNTTLLATSGSDKYINIWDYRQNLDVPVCQFESMVVGATQAVWDRQDPHTLASAHYGEIRLWDLRFPQRCKKYINAHKEQIMALDYSANRRGHLLSSSSDYTVKFWNVWQSCDEPREVINVPHAPVWKMRYTPFGEGVITLCTKALYNESNNLSLWSAHNLDCPVHTFYGHTDRVMEFCWRNINPSNDRNELQLVTWSKDHFLKIWPIGNYIVDKVGSPDDDDNEGTNQVVEEQKNDQVSQGSLESQDSSVEVLESGVDMNSEEDPTSGSFELTSTNPLSTGNSLEPASACSPMKVNVDSLITGLPENIFRVDPPLSVIDDLSREGNSSSPSLRLTGNSSISSDLDQTMASLEEDDKVPELKSSSMIANRSEFPADAIWQDYVPGSIKTVRSKSMEESVGEVVMDLASSIPAALFAKPQPNNLSEEIKSITLSSNVNFDRLDFEGKHCVLLAKTVRHLFYLSVDFPDDYPWASPPKFRSLKGTTMPPDQVNPILSRLRRTAQQQTDRRRRCLEMCVRQFEIAIDTYIQGEMGNVGEKYVSPFNVLGGLRDANVPFPRVTGGRFCGFDKLIIFTCPQDMHIQVQSQGVDKKVPRNFSIITNKESGSLFQTPSKSRKAAQNVTYERRYSKNRMSSTGSSTSEVDLPPGSSLIVSNKNGGAIFGADERDGRGDFPTSVKIFNVRKSLPYDMDLAMSYRLMNGLGHELARMNSGIAKNLHKDVAANAWALAHSSIKFPKLVEKRILQNGGGRCKNVNYTCSCPLVSEKELCQGAKEKRSLSFKSHRPLAKFHMGRQLLEQMIDHLIQHCDIVTAASILCVLDPPHPRPRPQALIRQKMSQSECPHTDTGKDATMENDSFKDADFAKNVQYNLLSQSHLQHQPHQSYNHQRHSSDPNASEGKKLFLTEVQDDDESDDDVSADWDQAAALIDPIHVRRNDGLKKTYRTLLHSAGFYLKATEVGKFIHFCDETITCKTTMEHPCTHCGNLVLGLTCPKCKFKDRHSICSICQTFVKGLSIYCFFCGHGGHMNHVRSWFMRSSLCASGCGCKCEFTMLAEEVVNR